MQNQNNPQSQNNLPNRNNPPNQTDHPDWKTRTYVLGTLLGAALGLISAYMFSRAAEENDEGKPQPIPTGTLIGLLLSLLTLIRQIAESGKPKKK